jgi:hypothetical protein
LDSLFTSIIKFLCVDNRHKKALPSCGSELHSPVTYYCFFLSLSRTVAMYNDGIIQRKFFRLDFRSDHARALILFVPADYLRRCRKSNRIRGCIRAKLRRTNFTRNLFIFSPRIQSIRLVSKTEGIAISAFMPRFFCHVFRPCYFFFSFINSVRERFLSRSCSFFPSTRTESAGTMIIVQLLLIAVSVFGLQYVCTCVVHDYELRTEDVK